MAKQNKTLVAAICLYGTRDVGTGWLASTEIGQLLGEGEVCKDRTFTECIWLAQRALREAGVNAGLVRVFASNAKHYADLDVNASKYYGDLEWHPLTAEQMHAVEVIEDDGEIEPLALTEDEQLWADMERTRR